MHPFHGELDHTSLNLREIKNVVDQVERTGCTGVDDVDMFQVLCIQRAVVSTMQEAVLIPSALELKIVTRLILQVA